MPYSRNMNIILYCALFMLHYSNPVFSLRPQRQQAMADARNDTNFCMAKILEYRQYAVFYEFEDEQIRKWKPGKVGKKLQK